jgi:hypothetical protein
MAMSSLASRGTWRYLARWRTAAQPWLAWLHSELTAAQRAALARRLALWAVVGLFLSNLVAFVFVDPDLWHEMALAREFVQSGRMPLDDRFAYTPTVFPSVHHEWGTGAVLFAIAAVAGSGGLMALKYALTAGVAGLCLGQAHRRGAPWELVALLAPVAITAGSIGFTTIRAQVFTLLLLVVLLALLDADRAGRRTWILLWLPLYVLWLNLHAGFVVGAGVVVLHTIEQMLRRQRVWHLVGVCAAMAALVVVNPYGWLYYPYLAHGLLLARPLITEWAPLWTAERTMFGAYLVSVLLAAYAVARPRGWQLPGVLIVAATAWLALRHTRHVSLYMVVWLSFVPAWLATTPVGQSIVDFWHRRQRFVIAACALVAGITLARATWAEPWRLVVPATQADEALGRPVYPAGAVAYLRQIGFRGNVMTPFVPGGYVLWNLHPWVKVSLDGRYEVAYQPGILERHVDFYDAQPGWQETLTAWPTDLVLVPVSSKVFEPLSEQPGWMRVYHDDTYALALPLVDARGLHLRASFP